MKKEVDQSDNILKLPGELSNLSQDDIGRIIR